MGKNPTVLHQSWTQGHSGLSMSASTPKGYLLYWDQANSLNQPGTVVFLVWNGGETDHQISCLLLGNPMETESPTNTTITSH